MSSNKTRVITLRPHPLAVECVQLKAKLMKEGLYQTGQLMEEVVTKIGWELAERIDTLEVCEHGTVLGAVDKKKGKSSYCSLCYPIEGGW